MSYNEEQHRRSRVVVETPAARREVVQTETARAPERRGVSPGVVAALVIGAVALVTILFLFLMNRPADPTTANLNVATQPTPVPQTTIIQQPAPQQPLPPVIVQQPPPATTTQPIVVPPPSATTSSTTSTTTTTANTQPGQPSGTDDTTIQSNIDRKITEDPTLAALDITAVVVDGKVTLTGTVETEGLRRSAERLVKTVKGVRTVDNQIIVSAP